MHEAEQTLPANHTPHDVTLMFGPQRVIRSLTLAPTEPLLRLTSIPSAAQQLPPLITRDGFCLPLVAPPRYTGLSPAGGEGCGTSVVVSQMVAEYLVAHPEAAPHVLHIYAPDTGPEGAVRDAKGALLGTTRLIRYK